jgi:hypothetical protein
MSFQTLRTPASPATTSAAAARCQLLSAYCSSLVSSSVVASTVRFTTFGRCPGRLSRKDRYQDVAANLPVKEVRIAGLSPLANIDGTYGRAISNVGGLWLGPQDDPPAAAALPGRLGSLRGTTWLLMAAPCHSDRLVPRFAPTRK